MKQLLRRTILQTIIGVMSLAATTLFLVHHVRAAEQGSTISYSASTNSFTFSATAPTATPVSYIVTYYTGGTTQGIVGSGTTDMTKTEYAGTCSTGGTCTPHGVVRGIYKVQMGDWCNQKRFTITDGTLSLDSSFNSDKENCASTDLTPAESSWLAGTAHPTATLRVCKVILNAAGEVTTGEEVAGTTLTIHGLHTVTSSGPSEPWGPFVFTTPLTLNSDEIPSIPGNDAQCFELPGMPQGQYYYSEEEINGSTGWASPRYNDQWDETVQTLADFRVYDGHLFDADPTNEGGRNYNGDGHIKLNSSHTRTLLVLNQYQTEMVSTLRAADPTPTPTETPVVTPTLTPTPTPQQGNNNTNGTVLAVATTPAPTPAVKENGQVLGASTELPVTGNNVGWLVIASGLLILGIGSVWKSIKLRSKTV